MKRVAIAAMLVLVATMSARGQFESPDPREDPRRRERPLIPFDDEPLAAPPAKAARVDPPAAKVLDGARAVIRDLFKKDIAAAKSPAQFASLGRVLLKHAEASKSDPVDYFALLEEAGSLAAKGGDIVTTFAAIDELTSAFTVNELELRCDALATLGSNLPPSAHKQIADLALSLIDPAIEADDYRIAREFVKIGGASARKAKDAAAAKTANTRTVEIEKLAKQYTVVKDALVKLDEAPANPEANLQVGSFYCFAKGNWSRGLPMLAKCGNASLKSLAEKDISAPTDPIAQVAVGNGWWDLSEQEEGPAKVHLQAHAADWYQKAIPKVSGLNKAKAEKRVAEVAAELVKGNHVAPALAIYAKAQDAVKTKQFNRLGSNDWGDEARWSDIPEQGGVLVGLDVGVNFEGDRIMAIQAVYATQRGEVRGPPFGQPTPKVAAVRAKPGFAIGGISVADGWQVEGLSVTFMRMNGDRLDPAESYASDYYGARPDNAKNLSGHGEPIIGLHGKISRDRRLGTIGVVTPGMGDGNKD